jgi:chromosome condensin MukBEF MukE localization factor
VILGLLRRRAARPDAIQVEYADVDPAALTRKVRLDADRLARRGWTVSTMTANSSTFALPEATKHLVVVYTRDP